jgi:hypothetical protein
MLRIPLSMVMLALALMLGVAGPAHAAKLTVQYQILDGSMNFPFSDPSNPVSGTLRVTIGGTGTTGSFLQSTGPVTLLSFNAATSGIALGLAPSLAGSGTSSGNLTFASVHGGLLLTGFLNVLLNLSTGAIGGTLTGTTIGYYASVGTLTFVGQEIGGSRQLVPEPATSTFAACALLGALGFLALRRRS